jgi:ATP synthase, F1 delta subunit
MDKGIVSGRYARALFRFAKKNGKDGVVYDETIALSQHFAQYAQIRRILSNPVMKQSEKEEVLYALFKGSISDELKNFIGLILSKKREDLLQSICLIYQDLYREANRILNVELTTASPVDEKTEKEVVKKIEDLTHDTVCLKTFIDPEIIGGYILKWDTYRWDDSVVKRLRRVERSITETMNNL